METPPPTPARPDPATAVELRGLSKAFGSVRALDGVTATLPKGAVGLLGPNGAGKSTLVKCLLGLVEPSGGSGAVLGIDIATRPLALRQQVGYMPEVDCTIPGMSAVEFVAYTGELVGMPPRAAMTRAHEVLDYVGLADERYRRVDTYSTGMRQRAKLAQALVHDPELLLLDEPTNGLDPPGREQMLRLVADLAGNHGKSVIYSSHLLADVERVCATVLILHGGRVQAVGALDELVRPAEEGYTVRVRGDGAAFVAALQAEGVEASHLRGEDYRLGAPASPGDPVGQRVLRAVRGAGVQLRAFRPVRATLEEAFLAALAPGHSGDPEPERSESEGPEPEGEAG